MSEVYQLALLDSFGFAFPAEPQDYRKLVSPFLIFLWDACELKSPISTKSTTTPPESILS
jgi:hypothetical protein